jgi:tetratricopeptide (TPR) repeat protein
MSRKRGVSFCMLNRDGAETIRECLESVAELVDEMIVVDTGSRDSSPEIARQLGATVVERPWPGDFSLARNEYLQLARGRWILSLDADEFLAPCRREELDALLDREPACAYRFAVRNYFLARDYGRSLSPGELADRPVPGVGVTLSHTIRLFFNHPGVAYSYPVHESLVPALRKLGTRIRDTDIPIHHLGFLVGRRGAARKFDRYLELGQRKLREHPGYPLSYFELGKLLSCTGKLEEAIELLDQCVRLAPLYPDAQYYAAVMRFRLKRYTECRRQVDSALRRFPGDTNLRYLRAMLDIREERLIAAAEGLAELAEGHPDHFPTHLHLAETCLRLGRVPEAESTLRKALELAPWEPGVYLIAAEIARTKDEAWRIDDIIARGVAAAGPVSELVEYQRVARALEVTA